MHPGHTSSLATSGWRQSPAILVCLGSYFDWRPLHAGQALLAYCPARVSAGAGAGAGGSAGGGNGGCPWPGSSTL
eukprot:491670-Amphidinium_carterae.1